jgi:ATP-dependent helicase/nuclease subunit B
MKAILGPFHPELENSLVDEIRRFKAADLMAPLMVLVPSDLLRRRLKILLGRERGLSLLNVQLLTFHQLALRLHAEQSPAPLDLKDDLFMEEALRQIVRGRRPGAEPFAGIEERAGGCTALWQTLRDLRDGLVDPTVALEALREGQFSQWASARTSELLLLLRSFQELCRERGLVDASDLVRAATEQAASTRFLGQFKQVFYYGFYDLTQIQIDFFQAVASHHPTTLFFPLLAAWPGHEAWRFAENFYQRYVQGHVTEPSLHHPLPSPTSASLHLFNDRNDRPEAKLADGWRCRIISAFGVRDEVSTVAKEILRLVDDEAISFHEIGVVARSLESYGGVVSEIFERHKIPLAASLETPLLQSPLTKAVILLLNLPAKDFVRSQVIDLLSSPYLRLPSAAQDRSSARPDLWDLATRELAICKGAAEWRRLRNFTRRDLLLAQIADDDEPRVIRVPAAQLTALADTVETLSADLVNLPAQASWREHAEAWQAVLQKYFAIAPLTDDTDPTEPDDAAPIKSEIYAVLQRLAALDAVNAAVTLDDFSHTFEHWLERSTLTDERRNHDGVWLLNAGGARGLKFRALFLLGMNEGVFPRTIREDAFLRDSDREVIERDLGYKVNPKLAAFDEEKLLFTLLVGAAREKLYCSFQRADDSGRALSPSWYLDELKRALERAGHGFESVTIPRASLEKSRLAPFDRQDSLPPAELAIRLTLTGQDPTALIQATAALPALYSRGRKMIFELDRSSDRLLAYDGLVGRFDDYWQRFAERGLSPTALETYARCPFQFFARHVLGLLPLDRPEEVLGPSPAEFGQLGHEILTGFYQTLIDCGYFAGKAASVNIDELLSAVAARAYAEYAAKNPVGYPLAWEHLQESLSRLLRQVIAQDLAELSGSGFVPLSLEQRAACHLPSDWPEPLANLAIRGRMDRIDRKADQLRVIDYKFKFGANPTTADKNLIRAALRGERLQPPFYYLLAAHGDGAENHAASVAEAAFYYIAQRWSGGPLISASYDGAGLRGSIGAATKQTIAYLAGGVRQGRFFLNRADHCSHCDVAIVCRKNHPPSLWRAENDPLAAAHQALRQKDPKKL